MKINKFVYLLICFLCFGQFVNGQETEPSEKVKTETVQKLSSSKNDANSHSLGNDEAATKEENLGYGRFFSEFISMLFALGLIIGLMLVIAWALKRMLHTRMHQMNTSSAIKILERRTLNPKAALYLLDINGKGIVIAESSVGIHQVAEVPLTGISSNSFSQEKDPAAFSKILQEKMKKES